MQDREKNNDFIIIYSFISEWGICKMKTDILSDEDIVFS